MVLAWQCRLKDRPTFMNVSSRIHQPVSRNNADTANRLLGNCKAKNTLKTYDVIIKQFEKFTISIGACIDPASPQLVGDFICNLADGEATLSTILRIGPSLALLHESQGHKTAPSVQVFNVR
jgi:hypothetical protein